MAYIKVENLKYRYPNTTKLALDGLDFEIEKGEICVLLGPSGSGKSTLLNIKRFFCWDRRGERSRKKYALSGVQRSCSGIFQRGLWRKSSDRGH